MMKARLLPLYFAAANDRERGEFNEQLGRLKEYYGDVAEFLQPACVGEKAPGRRRGGVSTVDRRCVQGSGPTLKKVDLPMVVLTSKFGTV